MQFCSGQATPPSLSGAHVPSEAEGYRGGVTRPVEEEEESGAERHPGSDPGLTLKLLHVSLSGNTP